MLRGRTVALAHAAARRAFASAAATAASVAQGPTNEPLLEQSISHLLDEAVEKYGDREALVCYGSDESRLTFSEMRDEAERMAAGFRSLGLIPGDRIGIWSPNRAEWVLTMMAAAKAGLILVSVNPAYRSSELVYALNRVDMRCIVTAPRHKSSMYVDMLRDVVGPDGPVPGLKHVVVLPGSAEDAGLWRDEAPHGMIRWADVASLGNSEAARAEACAVGAAALPDDPAGLQFTSGTTGSPKAVTLTHRGLVNNAFFVGGKMGLGEDDVILGNPPLYHCLQQVLGQLAGLARGSKCVYPAEGFDPAASIRHGAAEGATAIYGTPTMFIGMLDHSTWEAHAAAFRQRARTGVAAGSVVPNTIMRRINSDMGASELTICYGMTETSPVSFQTARDDPEWARCETIGRVLPHVEARIVDPETGAVQPRGVPGEIQTRGYLVMKGYWGDDEATASAIKDGWMLTGDLGSMDEHGYVRVEGRLKDLVIRGGENVSPAEVEEHIHGHEAVADVQVVGVPDDRMGEEVCAWVQLRDGHRAACAPDDPFSLRGAVGEGVSAEDIRNHCRGRIAHHKVPRYVRFLLPGEEFPVTVTGKIQKYVLRERSAAELAQQ